MSGEIDGTMQDWPDLTEEDIWNAALDAAVEECEKGDSPYDAECERYFARRILALKKGGTQ